MPAHPNNGRHQHSAAVRHQAPTSRPVDYDTWAEMLIKTNRNSFGRPNTEPNFGPWARRPLPRLPAAADELNPPPSTTSSRAQTIEKYRQEMMDLVRNMPEEEEEGVDVYELSLRDIVESPVAKNHEEEKAEENKEKKRKQRRVSAGENKGVAEILLKAFIPRVRAALGSRRRIAGGSTGKGAKVSPKPSNIDCEESSSSNGSRNSAGMGRNRGRNGSCYFFLHRNRSRSMEI